MDLIGVLHLAPLPGAPTPSPGLDVVIDRAIADARTLLRGGFRAAVVENIGDAPFDPGAVEPDVTACMTAVALRVRQATGGALALGINVLRNDARSALGVALASKARFIRVNVHTGAAWTDQGLIQGRAADTLRQRRRLGLAPVGPPEPGWLSDPGDGSVRIVADVHVKHATPAGQEDIADAAADLYLRGGADVVIVTGRHTGGAPVLDDIRRVRERLPAAPLWVGSGVQPDNVEHIAPLVDGAIVGTWLHRDADLRAPLDPHRVRRLVQAVSAAVPR
ncbi:MAG: phosphorybosylanthranilate isomerase [Deltaproteobacteria bacterium]|nr:MAG: phosphorybosylanthranilate isomerase [Deltaproteobacteria bacterium]